MGTSGNTWKRRITFPTSILIGVLLSAPTAVLAETLSLIKDINTCSDAIPAGQIARLPNGVVAPASFRGYGRELGIVSGDHPVMVRDLSPGEEGSTITFLFVFNEYVYFDLLTSTGDRALWRSDGTNAGTTMVVDYDNGALNAQRIKFSQALNNFYVVQTKSTENAAESIFWVGNGASIEGKAAIDNLPGHTLTEATVIGAAKDALIVRGVSAELGGEPYVLRATGKLTLLDDIVPGTKGSNPIEAVEIGSGHTVLFGSSPNTTTALYSTDIATGGNPLLIDELKPTSGTTRFSLNSALVSDRLYFVVSGADLSGIWVTDGTPKRSQRVTLPEPLKSSSALSLLGSFQGRLLFCDRAGGTGCEPILSDGTPGGTMLLKDINPGDAPSFSSDFTAHTSLPLLVFSATEPTTGQELYRTNGTPEGTSLFADLKRGPGSSVPRDFFVSGSGSVEFVADSPLGSMIMSVDPTFSEIKPTALLGGGLTASSSPRKMVALEDGNLLFFATTCGRGKEYQVLDITSGQVEPIFEDNVAIVQDRVLLLATIAKTAFFSVNTPGVGTELWISNSEPRSAKLLIDILPGPEGSFPNNGGVVSGRYFFAATRAPGTLQLWSSDGTPEGTNVLRGDLTGLQGISTGVALPSDPNTLYFLATFRTPNSTTFSLELWSTQGTPETTKSIAAIGEPSTDSQPNAPIVVGTNLVFPATTSAAGKELWGSDGSAAGTGPLGDLTPGRVGSSTFLNPAVFKGKAYFLGTNKQLIESDGTAAGTRWSNVLKDAAAGSSGVVMHETGKVLFARFFTGTQAQLYVTDGASTSSLTELAPSISLANPGAAELIGEDLYFEALNASGARELWRSDGSAKGTRLVLTSTTRKPVAFSVLHTFAKGLAIDAYDSALGNELFFLASENDQSATDFCPTDPQKKFPGICGCGVPDTDTDGDGSPDCNDQCPLNRFLSQAQRSPCECEVELKDVNKNGIADCLALEESRFHLKKIRAAARSLRVDTTARVKQGKKSLKVLSDSMKQLQTLRVSGAAFYSIMSDRVYQGELSKLEKLGKQLRKAFSSKNSATLAKAKKKYIKSVQTLSGILAAS